MSKLKYNVKKFLEEIKTYIGQKQRKRNVGKIHGLSFRSIHCVIELCTILLGVNPETENFGEQSTTEW